MQESPEKTPYRRWVFRVAGGIHRTYLRLPWHSTCLVQAIAAMLMLQRRGLDSTLYLGVAREGDVDLAAHAWLRSGDVLVTGVDEQQQYKTISSFMKTGSASTPQESTQNE